MDTSDRLQKLLFDTVDAAKKWRHEFVTPEHFLYILTRDEVFIESYEICGGDAEELRKKIKKFFKKNYEQLPEEAAGTATLSRGFEAMLERGALQADASGKTLLELTHVFYGMIKLPECYAVYFISEQNVNVNDVFFELCYLEDEPGDFSGIAPDRFEIYLEEEYEEADDEEEEGGLGYFYQDGYEGQEAVHGGHQRGQNQSFKKYVTCLNDVVERKDYTPLIGREEEIEETILILCRRDKNNPLHIGEPGVGKTAITYGLVRRIVEDNVPDCLKDAKVYSVDMGSMVAGTQYRGDFEKRMKLVLDGLLKEEKAIVYLDEIHNIIGAGAVSGGSLDASNILKPYLAGGQLRFIGATTYEEYKKHFEQSKSMVRRFQNVDIKEPSKEETVRILMGLRAYYEDFHRVLYPEAVLSYAVDLSEKYMNERFLPDKAIDLMDEAGAYLRLHHGEWEKNPTDVEEGERQGKDKNKALVVTKDIIDEVLAKFLKIPKQNVASDEAEQLRTLEERLKSGVFGQDEAVSEVCRAIKMSRAGLNEDNKPVASFLFVGPTGVGKTEIARTLAKALGVEMVRFDMSEYMEKHSIAKFIGAPAGYVGYEEGGMLTDAIRKKPHCVLLLDEIEKAHPDIFNVLLQVMDYATLSDNQGRKADFRNVILIMTSNAGASRLGKPAMGFNDTILNQGAIWEEVKRLFAPEFRNRLSRIITFASLNHDMVVRIVDKQLHLLAEHLAKKQVTLSCTSALREMLAKEGMSTEYGAREIQRVIDAKVKPVLVEELLFGELKDGGRAVLDFDGEQVSLRCEMD